MNDGHEDSALKSRACGCLQTCILFIALVCIVGINLSDTSLTEVNVTVPDVVADPIDANGTDGKSDFNASKASPKYELILALADENKSIGEPKTTNIEQRKHTTSLEHNSTFCTANVQKHTSAT